MSRVICPNCHAVVQYARYCANCKLCFKALQDVEQDTAASLTMFEDTNVESTATQVSTSPEMDPTLQWYCAKFEQGVRKIKTASTNLDEVAVIAKVAHGMVDKFEKQIEKVKGRIGLKIDPNPKDNEKVKSSIITARIPITSAEEVRGHNSVISLKASRRLKSALFRTVRDVKADLLPDGHIAHGGSGVIIGIVDIGLNFFHEKFRNKDAEHTTRILSFWNQSAPADPGPGELGTKGPFGYGRVFSQEDINKALKRDDPFAALNYRLSITGNERDGVHATPVTDIAAGNDRGRLTQFGAAPPRGTPGIAPEADIVFVELSSSGIAGANSAANNAMFGDEALEASFADSAQLLEAIAYIFDFAEKRNKPCVVNISMGTNGGPHDGSTPIEEAIDRLVSQAPNRAVVIAAGNFAASNSDAGGTHVSGTVTDEPFHLRWEVREDDPTGNELEIWYSGDDFLQADIIAPGGQKMVKLSASNNSNRPVGENSKLFAVHRIKDPNNHDNLINLFLERGAPSGIWTVRLSRTTNKDVDFHAWIERDHRGRSVFLNPSNDVTLSSIACGRKAIIVGAYDAHTGDPSRKPLPSSSFGPTRRGGKKPDISAPGVGIKAASFEGNLEKDSVAVFPVDGTSMASAVVTGVVALMLSEARRRDLDLDIDAIREILIEASKPDDAGTQEWDKQLGFGRLSAFKAIKKVIERASNND